MSAYRKLSSELSYLTGGYFIKPNYLSLITTFRCNLNCRSCAIHLKKDFNELSLEKWLKISRQLKRYFPKTAFVEINGGEPLLDKELTIELIKDLSPHFLNLVLNTNGTLIDEEIIEELIKAGLDKIKISFYSLDREIHNSMRGSSVAYDKAKEAIDLVLNKGINLEAGVLITKENISSLPELIEYLSKKGAVIILQPLDEIIESKESRGDVNQLPLDQWPKREEVKEFFDWLRPRINQLKIKTPLGLINRIEGYYLNPKSALNYRCFVGQRNLVIYPDGEVAFCFKSKKLGNLNSEDIEDILKREKTAVQRKKIKQCEKLCRIIGCNFSRGVKEYFNL